MKRTIVILFLLVVAQSSFSQKQNGLENLAEFDERLFHFGFTLGYNNSNFRMITNNSNYSLNGDSLIGLSVDPQAGFNLGIVTAMHLTKSLKMRFIPSLSFQERKVRYTYQVPSIGDTTLVRDQKVESTFLDFPLNFKFRTYRASNFAASFLVGGKYSLDMASQKDVTEDDILKIKKPDFSFELGVGTDFFLQYFKFGLEIKYSMGIPNALIQENNPWSRPIDSLKNQMWLLSITFEG